MARPATNSAVEADPEDRSSIASRIVPTVAASSVEIWPDDMSAAIRASSAARKDGKGTEGAVLKVGRGFATATSAAASRSAGAAVASGDNPAASCCRSCGSFEVRIPIFTTHSPAHGEERPSSAKL